MSLVGSIFLAGMPQAAFAETPEYDPVFYYYHPDHLGSAQLMTDRNGELVQHYGYQPFGEERYRNNTDAFSVSNRYTGQTLDEETGLYYYGARYYDPELARFVQADSTVPDPEFSQAYNRYAYVYNNPFKFTDPTGQFPFLIGLAISMAISGGMAAATGGNVLQGILLGAFSYAVGFGVGQLVGGFEVCGWGLTPTGCAMVGGAVAGAMSAAITGGNPAMGALLGAASVGAASALSDVLPSAFTWIGDAYLRDLAASTAAGALIGGVTAEVMGGEFGEGAAYGAASAAAGFVVTVALVRDLVMEVQEMYGWGINGKPGQVDWAAPEPPNWGYETPDDAARAALAQVRALTDSEYARNPLSQHEYGGYIYKFSGKYGYTSPVRGTFEDIPPEAMKMAKRTIPAPGKRVAAYHSHARVPHGITYFPDRFSGMQYRTWGKLSVWILKPPGDIPFCIGNKIDGYVSTPHKGYLKFDVKERTISPLKK